MLYSQYALRVMCGSACLSWWQALTFIHLREHKTQNTPLPPKSTPTIENSIADQRFRLSTYRICQTPFKMPCLSTPATNLSLEVEHVVARSSPDTSPDIFNVSQALFAGLSVLIALLALVVGLLQLRRHRSRNWLRRQEFVCELEAPCSRVCPLEPVVLSSTAADEMQRLLPIEKRWMYDDPSLG